MRSFRVEGIVIKRKDFGEADRILTVFTRHQGKIQVIAKGVRKINSRRSAHVELLNHCILNIHEAKLPILTEAEALNHFSPLKNQYSILKPVVASRQADDVFHVHLGYESALKELLADVFVRLAVYMAPAALPGYRPRDYNEIAGVPAKVFYIGILKLFRYVFTNLQR